MPPTDKVWSKAEENILRSLSLRALKPVPASHSNRYADNSLAAQLGEILFFDARLSANGKISCASCHQPEKYFTDGLPRAIGMHKTGRNTPTIVASAWLRWFYWDGRRDSLWSQALIPFEASNEMGSSRLAIVRFIAKDSEYREMYEVIFGAYPKVLLSWLSQNNLPIHAGPLGDSTIKDHWYRLPLDIQHNINLVYTNIGKAIEAYERTLLPKTTRFDRYVGELLNDEQAKLNPSVDITPSEVAGIKLFINANKTQCLQCHNGPLQSNNDFHNIGTGNFSGMHLDFGRMLGLQAVLIDEFNCMGNYSDAKKDQCLGVRFLNKAQHVPLKGAYKTPSLRNLSPTAPYFHDGRFTTLLEVVKHYNNPPVNNGPHELKALSLNDGELDQLVSFLNMLNEIE